MQRDFHYYCVAVLARAAGFNPRDALVIAYASQYVDDATENGRIPLEVAGGILEFDPVRTSYSGLEMATSVSWSAQKRVWIPFHFIPAEPFKPLLSRNYSYFTRPNSSFARWLVDQAAGEPPVNQKRRLCRIGIALHTLADCWSHEGFSGRQNAFENDVENIHIFNRRENAWERLGIENILFDILPQIGHAEAACIPDLAFERWKYSPGKRPGEEVERDNVIHFLRAAEVIYQHLCGMDKIEPVRPIPWEGIEPGIRGLFAQGPSASRRLVDKMTVQAYRSFEALDIEKRCEQWERTFNSMFQPLPPGFAYHYDRQLWRQQAMEGDTDWDDYSKRQWQKMPPRRLKSGFWDSLWVHFHRSALHHRHLVLENLP